jgi:uncharacterized protein (TIGR02099 family)
MQKFFHRLIKFLAYSAAGFVILLAVAVGLFRLFLPRLPEYQDELKAWASDAIGLQVEFSGMDARWGLSGPELNFYDAELIRPVNNTRLLAASEVSIGVGVLRLLRDRTVVVDRILVRETTFEVRERADGRWWIQGTTLDQLAAMNQGAESPGGEIKVVGEDVVIELIRLGDQQPILIDVSDITVARDQLRIAIDASLRLPESMGKQMTVAATQVFGKPPREDTWDISVSARDLALDGWTALVADKVTPLASGVGAVDLSVRLTGDGLRQASAEFDFANVAAAVPDAPLYSLGGRLEYRHDARGWLIALSEFALQGPHGSWPESALRLELGNGQDGALELLDIRADYLNVEDVALALPWLPAERQDQLARLDPDGIFRDLSLSVADLDSDIPDFAISADFESLGLAATGQFPGVRNLSGRVRADRAGGLADIDAVDVVVDLPRYLSSRVPLDDVYGTLIWRQSDERITVLSDSIVLRNADISTNSNVELILEKEQGPFIDLSSTFSVTEIAGVKKLIPDQLMKPKLYDWFQAALVGGEIQGGRVRLNGPLRAFPFDNGEGSFIVEAGVRDAEFKYLPNWPAVQLIDVDVVLDGMHLYTRRNRAVSLGNRVIDAKVDVRDLREPELTIDATAAGTLDTMRQFGNASPLAKLFAGQLDMVEVSGDATLKLDLEVPIKRPRDFDVTAKIEATGGSALVPGLRSPLTDLSGAVTIGKTTVSSESLVGRFVGRPLELSLASAPPEMGGYSMILNAHGSITAQGIVDGFGLPAGNFVGGETEYTVSVMFPRANPDGQGALLTIEANSDLIGLAVDLPEPFAKVADTPLAFAGQMTIGRGAERIDTSGGVDDDLRWNLGFLKDPANGWDLDRGMLSLGDATPPEAETRGLHIRGNASEVVFGDWLALGSSGDAGSDATGQYGILERLRSVDVTVDSLQIFGQLLPGHRVRLDRSARDWLVQFEGSKIDGSVFVPYDLGGDRPVVMDMERLVLPGNDAAPVEPGEGPDPRNLPALSIRARDFGIGTRYFGALEAEIVRVPGGLRASTLNTIDETFAIEASGAWLHTPEEPDGSRTSLAATLNSTDVAITLARLGYSPGLAGDDMNATLDLSWAGGPRADFFDSLDGDVELRMGVGQLDEVEPGAGRVLGLMSIVALPRRLSLDFSDVFEKGFGFDKIEGTFRLDNGEAYTCNLSLEAPAADIAIIGRASLVNRDYEQTALIGANVGNVLPVAAAAAVGPQAAVAVLIFSQIFKKPLQGMGQIYYSIRGPWDTPEIDSANAEAFAETGRMAGCVSESGTAE